MNNNNHLLFATVLIVLAGLTLFREAAFNVLSVVLNRQGSSHGLFVPVLSAYFLWIKRTALLKTAPEIEPWGIIVIAAGFAPFLFNAGGFQVNFLGFIIYMSGVILFATGKNLFKQTVFPVFFLLTMIPIPAHVYDGLANAVRHVSFEGSTLIISALGIPFFKSGWLVELPNANLLVDISCSGIRYLVSYVVFGIAYAYLSRTRILSRIGTVALTVPISLSASILRLTVIFILTYLFGPKMAQPRPHIFISWCIFIAVLFTCVAFDQWLQKKR